MQREVEQITPYGGEERKGIQIEHAFNSIACRYDFMNRLLSLGIDTTWRRRAVKAFTSSAPSKIIDLATGTGDLAIMEARRFPDAEITGVDLSEGMLSLARKKAEKTNLQQRITFIHGDCLDLPYEDGTFDLATIAFGIRNFESLAAGCTEILRILRPGGQLMILELSRPQSKIFSGFYSFHLTRVTPMLGRLFTGKSFEYAYLQKSIDCVPQGEDMLELLRQSGFSECLFKTYTFGICSCYTALKPPTSCRSCADIGPCRELRTRHTL